MPDRVRDDTAQMVAFLRARLDEDEAMAREASGERLWRVSQQDRMVINDAGFLQEFTPARVLREVEAKRRIVEHHAPRGDLCSICIEVGPDAQGWPCHTLRLLALPYTDRSDYREARRP